MFLALIRCSHTLHTHTLHFFKCARAASRISVDIVGFCLNIHMSTDSLGKTSLYGTINGLIVPSYYMKLGKLLSVSQ